MGRRSCWRAAGIGIYIIGVTWFARSEAGVSRRCAAGPGNGSHGQRRRRSRKQRPVPSAPQRSPSIYWLLLALLMFTVFRRCAAAAVDPTPQKVQTAVKHSILSLIWLDAATALAVAEPMYGVAIAAPADSGAAAGPVGVFDVSGAETGADGPFATFLDAHNMLLGYNTNGFAHHDPFEAIELLAEIGYKSVALTLDHGPLNPFAADWPQICSG